MAGKIYFWEGHTAEMTGVVRSSVCGVGGRSGTRILTGMRPAQSPA